VIALDLLVVRAVTVNLGFFSIPLREMFMVTVWFSFLCYVYKKKLRLPFNGFYRYPLLILLTGSLITLIFANQTAVFTQLKHLFGLMFYFSYCYIAWIIYDTRKTINQFTKIIAAVSLIMSLYGIFCYIINSNPYMNIIDQLYENSRNMLAESARGDLKRRIQGTMSHPLSWGGGCCLLFVYFLRKNIGISHELKCIILLLLGTNVILSGSRSVILAFLMIFPLIFLHGNKQQKRYIFIGSIVLCSIILISLYLIPQLNNYKGLFESSIFFWDEEISKDNAIKGSSVTLRAIQLFGAINMIHGSLLVGLGHGFVNYYLSNFGMHPVLFGFESFIYVKLVEGGIIGLSIWLYLFYIMYRKVKKKCMKSPYNYNVPILQSYVIIFFIYGIFTGFMQLFLCFLILYIMQFKSLITVK
jgi:hypothetical protein